MKFAPLTGVLGAEITDLDASAPLTEAQADGLRAALDEFGVIVLHDQHLTPDQQVQFSRALGPSSPDPFVEGIDENPEVVRVVREADEGHAFNFGGAWHSDWSFLDPSPAYTVLHALDMPPYGGDTVWASASAAYEALPPSLRNHLDTVVAVHTARGAYSPALREMYDQLTGMRILTDERAFDTQEHPLIRRHPATDEPILFFNSGYVKELRGPLFDLDPTAAGLDPQFTDEASLRRWLHEFTTQHQFTFRHRWRKGDLVVWDNRVTQHLALADYVGYRRELHRTTVGEQPASPVSS